MPRYLVHISADDEERIQRLVERRAYQSVDHLLSVALRNQLLAEENESNPWTDSLDFQDFATTDAKPPSTMGSRKGDSRLAEWDFNAILTMEPPAPLPDPREEQIVSQIFWAQYYRFLPLKIASLVLFKMAHERPVPLVDYARTSVTVATRVYQRLRALDTKLKLPPGGRLSTSFPKPREKSQARFEDQFLISRRSRNGLLDGFLARAKFANLVEVDGELCVGLTRAGAEFVKLPNPVIANDSAPSRSLSEQEVNFLVDHLREKVPLEYNHMLAFLDALAGGADSRTTLDATMKGFYNAVLKGADRMTNEHVSSMRAGVQSRLQEMGFVASRRDGRNASCTITAKGMDLLRNGTMIGVDLRQDHERLTRD